MSKNVIKCPSMSPQLVPTNVMKKNTLSKLFFGLEPLIQYLLLLNQTAYLVKQGRLSRNKERKSRALWSSVRNRHDVTVLVLISNSLNYSSWDLLSCLYIWLLVTIVLILTLLISRMGTWRAVLSMLLI